MEKIILIDKPIGISSFDVIRRLRPKLNIRKMGHAGTLDPLASGLMIIGVGEGTKLLTELTKLDKEYVTEILIGEKTESGDQDGRVIEKREVSSYEAVEVFSKEKVATALSSMIGTLTLPVSAFSAIKKDGVPFYKKARTAARHGQVIEDSELPIREMKVYDAELLDVRYDNETKSVIVKVRFHVRSGTYIRSLGEELGKRLAPTPILPSLVAKLLWRLEKITIRFKLSKVSRFLNQWRQQQYGCGGLGDYPARLESLRRTKVGEFNVEDAEEI